MANILSDRTKNIDKTARQLAMDFKRSDIKTVRTGQAQPSPRTSGVLWGNPATYNFNTIRSVGGESVGAAPPRGLPGPRVGSYVADHENLKIKK